MKHSLTSGSIWRGMLLFALPILLGNIFQQLYKPTPLSSAAFWIRTPMPPSAPPAA